MNLADLPWRPMDDVPKDGSVIVVVAHEWNVSSNPLIAQLAQWFGTSLVSANSENSRP